MTTQTSHVSTYGRYVGRVGALAATLGIGVFVITTPGVASADSSSSSSTSRDTSANSSASTGASSANPFRRHKSTPAASSSTSTSASDGSTDSGTTSSDAKTSGATSATAQVPPGVTVSSSGGVHLKPPNVGHFLKYLADASSPPTTAGATAPPDTSGVEAQSADTSTPAQATVAPVVSALDAAATHPRKSTSTVKTDLNAALSDAAKATTPAVSAASVTTAVTGVQGDIADAVKGLSAKVTKQLSEAVVAATTQTITSEATSATSFMTAAASPATPTAQISQAGVGVVSFLNNVVTKLLNPFLNPAPATQNPLVPVAWAVLGWVRRNLFNEAPTITYNPTTTVQTGQTVTGNIGATDPEGNKLTYTVTQQPTNGTVTIDQATGNFSYTPNAIDYTGTQTDSFTVSVTDGKTNLLSLFGQPHSAQQTIGLTVQPPTDVRTIVPLPAGFTNAQIPRFSADGQSLLFSATPPGAAAGARMEIYHVNVDGTDLTCVTCGLADPTPLTAGTTTPRELFKPVPFEDGSGRILMQSLDPAGAGPNLNVIYEPATATTSAQLVRVITPPGKPGVVVVNPQNEMRISPDGTHVLFSQIQLVPNPSDPPGFLTSVPIVGTLTPSVDASGNKVYTITNAQVVYPVGEGKQWTHDGKGVIVQGGLYDAGNVDDVEVDLATGNVTRLTGNLDYDEDADLAPNNQWIAIDSGRGQDMLTPVSRIERPAFVPLLIQGSVYTAYAGTQNYQNVTNQPSVIAVADDLNGENGLPLFVNDDGWTARSMPSWNADGTEVAFWEANAAGQSRLVVASLQYTTSAATPLTATQKVTPALSSTFPTLTSNTPQQVALPEAGTVAAPKIYNGSGGGTAAVAETTDPTTGHIIRTVVYTNYVNDEGMILNGTESTDQSAAQNTIRYVANITVSGTHTGSLTGDVTINKLTRTITPTTANSQIQSTLDGDTQVLLASIAEDRAAV
jgi:hypothetical protein